MSLFLNVSLDDLSAVAVCCCDERRVPAAVPLQHGAPGGRHAGLRQQVPALHGPAPGGRHAGLRQQVPALHGPATAARPGGRHAGVCLIDIKLYDVVHLL